MCVLIFSTSFVLNISHSKKIQWDIRQVHIGLHRENWLFSSYLNQTWVSLQIFKKAPVFHENASSGSRVVPRGRTDRHDEVNSSFNHSFHRHVQNLTIPCRSQELLPFLSVMYFSCHPSPPTILPSSLTSSCYLFLGLPLSLVVRIFIYNILFGNSIFFHSLYMSKPT
jgi:hypothetical protein